MIDRFTPARIAFFLLLITPAGITFAQPTPAAAPASASVAAPAAVKALPLVSPIFTDNMVLQRGKLNTIWGWSEPGDKVKVADWRRDGIGVAGADRRWQVKIKPPPVGGPYTVKITGAGKRLSSSNVLVGDVWICGGQSNMGLPLRFTTQRRGGGEDGQLPRDPLLHRGGALRLQSTDLIERQVERGHAGDVPTGSPRLGTTLRARCSRRRTCRSA